MSAGENLAPATPWHEWCHFSLNRHRAFLKLETLHGRTAMPLRSEPTLASTTAHVKS